MDRVFESARAFLWLVLLWTLAAVRTCQKRWNAYRSSRSGSDRAGEIWVTRAALFDHSGEADVTHRFATLVEKTDGIDDTVAGFREKFDVSWFESPGDRLFFGVEYVVPGPMHSGQRYAVIYDMNNADGKVKFPPTTPTEGQRLSVSLSPRRVLSASLRRKNEGTESLVTEDAIALAGPMRDMYVGDGMPPPVDGAVLWIARNASDAGSRHVIAGDDAFLAVFYATGQEVAYHVSSQGLLDGPDETPSAPDPAPAPDK